MKLCLSALLGALFLAFGNFTQAEKVAPIQITGALNPETAGYIARSMDEATSEKAQCLILQLDTPGCLAVVQCAQLP